MHHFVKALNDKNISFTLCILLVVILSFFSDKLSQLKNFMNNWYGKLITLSIILFVSHHNLTIALLLSLLFLSKVKEDLNNPNEVGPSSPPSENEIDSSTPVAAVGSGIAAFLPFLLLLL